MATPEQLSKIIEGKAKYLCSPEGERIINKKGRRTNGAAMNDPDPSDYMSDANEWDNLYLSENYDERVRESGFPDSVKRALTENRMRMDEGSVLDEIGVRPAQERKEYGSFPQSTGGIDYSIIKAIVNECLNEHLSGRGAEVSSLKTIGLKAGTITLVDNSGNVYKAKLEKIGNKNQKKGDQ